MVGGTTSDPQAAEPGGVLVASRPGWIFIAAFCLLTMIVGVTTAWLLKANGWTAFATAAPGSTRQTIAVLPIQGAGANPDPLFVEVHEAFISALGRIAPLRVIARTSVMRYEGSGKLIPEIGRELNADYIVETTASHDGDRVQMMTRLVRVKDDTPLWATTIERPLTDVLNMGGIALKIAGVMGVSVSPDARAALVDEYTPNSAAQAAYLEGRYAMSRGNEDGLRAALALFERAVALDPKYARAYASLARGNIDLQATTRTADEAPARAVAAGRHAVEIDDGLAAGHVWLAWATFLFNRDWNGADRQFRRAVHLNPSDVDARVFFANFLSARGQLAEAKQHIQIARELAPFSGEVWGLDAMLHYYSREFDQAEALYRRAAELAPTFSRYIGLGRTLAEKRDCTGAAQAIEHALRSSKLLTMRAGIAYAYAVCGQADDARQILHELEVEPIVPGADQALHYNAYVYAALGDKDRAFELLMRAAAERRSDMLWARVDPRLDPLRSDPRFRAYLRALEIEE